MARLLCGTSPVESPLEGRQSLGTRDRNSATTPRSRQASALERRLAGASRSAARCATRVPPSRLMSTHSVREAARASAREPSDLGWVRQRAAGDVYPRTTDMQLGLVAIIDRPEGSGAALSGVGTLSDSPRCWPGETGHKVTRRCAMGGNVRVTTSVWVSRG